MNNNQVILYIRMHLKSRKHKHSSSHLKYVILIIKYNKLRYDRLTEIFWKLLYKRTT